MKKLLSILLCAVLFFQAAPAMTASAAVSWPSDVSIEAEGGIVIDADSGIALYG